MKIKKNLQKVLNNKYISLVFIPIILLISWCALSLSFNDKISFSVLMFGQGDSVIKQTNQGKLFKTNKIYGEFTAKENHLGIVLLRFKEFVKPDYRGEDVLSLRLKEKGAKDWYYFNNYRSGSIERQLLFPFGFPIIDDSKGRIYQFEIESLFGNSTNAVELSNNNPQLMSAYQFPREEIAGSKMRFISFFTTKTLNSFTNIDFLLSSILFLLPFLFYVLWQLLLKKLSFVKQFFSFLIIALVCFDIFLLLEVYMGVIMGLIFAWMVAVKIYRLESSVSFSLAFMLIFVWLILMVFKENSFSSKLNIWTYAFLVIGAIQAVIEEKNQSKNLIGYKKFFGGLFKFSEKI